MLTRSPKFLAPALHPNVISTEMIEAMGDPDEYWAHWLSAGAGAGKTQGTRLWLEGVRRPYGWIQLDELDNDPFSFLEHLYECLAPLLREDAGLPELFPQGRLALDRHCEFVWDQLILGLREPSILVLDDAHQIDAWDLHPVLHHLLLHPHPSLHVVVVSRREIPERYAREVVNRQVRLVQAQAFVWNEKHLRQWIRKRWKIEKPGAEFVRSLLAISQGGAGVLALLDLKALRESGASLQSAAGQLELESLMEETLLRRLTPEELEVLRWLACLGSFPERWLTRFAFPVVIRDCVEQWLEQSSVVAKLERSEGELRFHPLFAELLRRGSFVPHQSLARLRVALIEDCVDQGRVLDAMELTRETGMWSRYWELVRDAGQGWIEQGQLGLLSRALGSLPAQVRAQLGGPVYSLFSAADCLHAHPDRAYGFGLKAVREASGVPALRAIWAMALSTTAASVVAGGMSMALFNPVIEELNQCLEQPWFAALPASLRLTALRAGVIALLSGTDRLPLPELCTQIDTALAQCNNVELRAEIVSTLMRIVALHGLVEFYEPASLHVMRLEHEAKSPTAKTAVFNAKTSQCLMLGKKAGCVNAANATLAGYSSDSPSVWKLEVLCLAAYSCLSNGDLSEAKRYSRELGALSKQAQYQSATLHWHIHAGAIAAHGGDYRLAKRHYEEAKRCSDESKYAFVQMIARAGLVVIDLELGDPEGAKRQLEECEVILKSCNMPSCERIHSGSRAFYAMREDTLDKAKDAFLRMFEVMRRSDSFSLALDLFPQHPQFLGFALEHDIEVELVHRIIRRAPLFPCTRPHPRWPYLYEAKVLGGFEFKVNGVCERNRLASSGPRFQLLTILLWYGKKGVPLTEVVPKIWYYLVDEERQFRAYRAAVKRLLEDLGRKDAMIETEERLYLNAELWSVEAWALEEELARGEEGPEREAGFAQLRRGFVGPTPIPQRLRDVIPSRGGLDLGPEGVLRWVRGLL